MENLNKLINSSSLSKYKIEKDLSLNKNQINKWLTGTISMDRINPSLDNAKKLADYFNVSIDYLVGRTDVKEMATGRGFGEDMAGVSKQAQELVSIFEQLSVNDKKRVLADAKARLSDVETKRMQN